MAETRTECLACRITGTATFTGLGIYALWMSREAAPGSRGSKKFVALFGAGCTFLFAVAMEPSDKEALPVPTSVLDFQRYGGIGKLHFKYDMSVLASNTDKVVVQLREDGAQLARKLARAQEEGQSLLTELGRLQHENARLTKALDVSQAQNSLAVQNARDVRAKAEEQLQTLQNANRGLMKELQGTHRMLQTERVRAVSATSAVVRLRAERNSLRTALREKETKSTSASTIKVKVEDDVELPEFEPQRRVSLPDTRPESPAPSPPSSAAPSSASVSPLVTIDPHPVSSPPQPSATLLSPLHSPPLIAPSVSVQSQPSRPLPPPAPAQRAYSRPTVTSSVPRPSFVMPKDTSSTSASRPSPPAVATANGSAQPPPSSTPAVSAPSILASTPQRSLPIPMAASPALPPAGIAAGSPGMPANSLKRKRSLDSEAAKEDADDDEIVLISGPTRSRGASPSTRGAPAPVRSQASSPAARRPSQLPPRPQSPPLRQPQPQPQTQPSANPAPPPPSPSKPKLGIKHLPLLYETRGNMMYCRTCKHAFPEAAAWADLVGHSQGTHADICAELEMLRPVQVIEQTQRLQGLGAGVVAGAGAGAKKGRK